MTVALVGAGPGDPGLITFRGWVLLRDAEVVVYDRLASRALLDLAPPQAKRVDVGKAPGKNEMSQDDINALLVDQGRAGKRVVRLKGGDPFVFGRGGEEAEALAAAGVPFEVVPGVTSAIAAPAYAGIPVTHRGLSTSVTIVTGHEDPTKGRADVDWAALARVGGTLVILMGAGRIGEIASALIDGGLASETPVAAVRHGTCGDQQTVRGTLATIGGADVQPPSAIVVGDVAALDLTWFENRPLFGRNVVVTRAREQASELRAQLESLGAEVIELPTIAIEALPFSMPRLDPYSWIVFTSANGVKSFFARAHESRGTVDARIFAGIKLAVIGLGTETELTTHGLAADLMPDRFVAESLVAAFPPPDAPGERILLPRAEKARDVLPEGLDALGYRVDVLPVYRTIAVKPDVDTLARVRAGHVDAITFTSSSTVNNFCDAVGELPEPQPLVVSIGPVTSKTAEEWGLRVDVEANEHTIEGLVTALVDRLGR
jgi:uroporphyrinogen III methyltransferase/synthase